MPTSAVNAIVRLLLEAALQQVRQGQFDNRKGRESKSVDMNPRLGLDPPLDNGE